MTVIEICKNYVTYTIMTNRGGVFQVFDSADYLICSEFGKKYGVFYKFCFTNKIVYFVILGLFWSNGCEESIKLLNV